MKRLWIHHQRTPPYAPQCNPVERANRTLKTMIAQFVGANHRAWHRQLPELVFAANTAVHEGTGYTPASLTYGRELPTPGSVRLEHEDEDEGEAEPHPNRQPRAKRLGHMRDAYQMATLRQQEATERQGRYYNLRRRDWRPEAGDAVMKREHPLSNAAENFAGKLAPKYTGPYMVRRIVSPVIVQLEENGRNLGNVHIKDLKKYGQE
ncbi:hypothetical protein DMN91_011900 [Ooceraea biroi]|uniref:Integrase catalytic domain-containing protein n=1 Tax=Ooceraea biroi TaxID=2015173 RepID=A0A3L8D7D3_OOCBI|nr:uncharacterized protein LOC113563020 [Ooceraea biroi]RLU16082.1 hypothetical protein DMN91_011840 [Ooceraea biroi]RLU16141.1 hypothetical protein DMN91_011900 [Ooceraea biroi]